MREVRTESADLLIVVGLNVLFERLKVLFFIV